MEKLRGIKEINRKVKEAKALLESATVKNEKKMKISLL